MFELTGFQRDCLVSAAGLDRPSGQSIRETVERSTTYGEISHGQLYPNLDVLVDRGLLERGELDKRTNSYVITRDGWDLIHQYTAWLEQSLPRDAPPK